MGIDHTLGGCVNSERFFQHNSIRPDSVFGSDRGGAFENPETGESRFSKNWLPSIVIPRSTFRFGSSRLLQTFVGCPTNVCNRVPLSSQSFFAKPERPLLRTLLRPNRQHRSRPALRFTLRLPALRVAVALQRCLRAGRSEGHRGP
jgi:hypothetical protein